jgi:hypothetical protein
MCTERKLHNNWRSPADTPSLSPTIVVGLHVHYSRHRLSPEMFHVWKIYSWTDLFVMEGVHEPRFHCIIYHWLLLPDWGSLTIQWDFTDNKKWCKDKQYRQLHILHKTAQNCHHRSSSSQSQHFNKATFLSHQVSSTVLSNKTGTLPGNLAVVCRRMLIWRHFFTAFLTMSFIWKNSFSWCFFTAVLNWSFSWRNYF